MWTDIHRIKHNKYRDKHPCQLPVHLLERIILFSSDEGDVVLDPFLGTGTTAIAAKRLGRRYIGFELSEEYVEVASKRLEMEQTPSRLEGMWVSCFLKDLATVRSADCESEAFQNLYNWPQDDDGRKQVDVAKIKLKKEYQAIVNELCK